MSVQPIEVCPDSETLSAYARDELPTSAGSALDRHLVACDRCREQFLNELGRPLLIPEVPDCRVVQEIGRGRFGVVYKAWRLVGTPRLVALKVLSSVGEMERGRFEREIAVLRHLDAPGFVKCLDAGGSGESAYFVMDYVEGVHFDEFSRSESVSFHDKLEVFERVCRIVALAHAHGIIHRDLKPRNILVDDRGQPHVLDFGICSVDSADRSSWVVGTLTHPGDVIGTLRYMSPEQAWGGAAGPIDERSDLWSLGIMLHELVTGGGYPYSVDPTPDKSAHEALLDRIRKETPTLPRLTALPRGRDLETLLERCLAWEPRKRIASAAALADDLAAYRRGQRIRTRPLSLGYRMTRLAVGAATRSRWTFAAASVALVTTVLSAASLFGLISWKERVMVGPDDTTLEGTMVSDARDGIVVVGVYDDSVPAMTELATAIGIDGVTEDARTWRRLHVRLLRRLVEAKPRAVVWDYHFTSEQSADHELAEAILTLERAGVPVVLATDGYDEHGRPLISPALRTILGDAIRHGAIGTRTQERRPGEFVVAMQRSDGLTVPTLWLATLAAVLHPEARLELDWPDRIQPVTLMYAMGRGLYRRERDALRVSRAFNTADPTALKGTGELVAAVVLDMHDPRHWEARSIPYERLLDGTEREHAELVRDKVVLIGDLRWSGLMVRDRHDVDYRGEKLREVPGCYLVAEAIAGLLSLEYLRTPFPLPPTFLLTVFGLSIAGCLVPIRVSLWRSLEPSRRRSALFAGLAALMVMSPMILVQSDSAAWVWTSAGCFATSLTMLVSFWVEFSRNRHRVAERQRRHLEDFDFEPVGTLTLPRTRLTSIPGIR